MAVRTASPRPHDLSPALATWTGALLLGVIALAAGCGPMAPTGNPLAEAAQSGDVAAAKSLLQGGADPNAGAGRRQFRPLSLAARTSRLEVMDALVAAGANPNLADAGGNRWVPLMHAVHKHQRAAVQFLLEHRALPDGPAGLRLTPLMMAAASGQTDVVRALLAAGADPRRRTPDGGSILGLAVSGGAFSDVDEPLLGACHPDTVRVIRAAAPEIGLRQSWPDRAAIVFARLNGCGEALTLASTERN